MRLKSIAPNLLMNSKAVCWLLAFIPHRFIIRLYFSSFLNHQPLPENSVFSIISGYGKGLKMCLRIGDKSNAQDTYYWLGLAELAIQRLFAKFIKPGFVVYDVGAYAGFYSLLAGRLVGLAGRVYAFEPSLLNVERLKLNISLNRMQDTVFCIPKAVIDKTTKSWCRNFGRDDWNQLIDTDSCEGNPSNRTGFLVDTISLDEFVFQENNPPPDLIKIDVEAQEEKVLEGARRLLKEYKSIIICEFHTQELKIKICARLTHLGYRIKYARGAKAKYGHIFAYFEEQA